MKGDSQVECTLRTSRPRRVAVVLWSGSLGGAQTLSVALAERMARLGAGVTIVFVGAPMPLAGRLEDCALPYTSVGLTRGRDVLRHPRRYAATVAQAGGGGALLLECGFMGAALRGGGYGGPIVAVEHGALLGFTGFSKSRRLVWRADRASGAWADDAEVAVSDYMLERLCRHPHARRTQRIYNGVDPEIYAPATGVSADRGIDVVVGFAGRLVPGKGAGKLIRAVALANERVPLRLSIAGEGPEREGLVSLAHALGVESRVSFRGAVNDMPAFWQECDIAAVASDGFVESFSMVTLEAMACGRPIAATRNGAIPELVLDGLTGTLVAPGDVESLARALVAYAEQPELRRVHGAAARVRAIENFHIDDCARAYLDLFAELCDDRSDQGPDPRLSRAGVAGETRQAT
jgi:glycosyltransferase involved in cell wall biosynthesis